jgi:hypothetical protein
VKAPPPQPSSRRRTRLTAAFACALLLAATAVLLVHTLERRRQVWELAYLRGTASDRPVVLATLGLVRDEDDASALVAESLLDSAIPGGAGEGLEQVRELLFESIAGRPGSAHFRALVGRAVPSGGRAEVALWERPLELARIAAPALDFPRKELCTRYLALWPKLTAERQAKAKILLEQSFRSASFVTEAFSEALFALGPENAVRLLPADPGVLMAALEVAIDGGDARATELVRVRLRNLTDTPAVR